jgi:2-succinyl-6-hydroxy-2,4-cyclohexadiene-1-carboxylate synthase
VSPLLCLHGFTGSPESFAEVRERLASRPVSCPALVGHGERAPEIDSFEAEVDRLARLLPEEPVTLVGYSLGARLALGLAVRHPKRVRSAVFIGVHPGLRSSAERDARRTHDRHWIELLETRGLDAFVSEWERQPLFASQAGLPEPARERRQKERRRHDPLELARCLRLTGLAEMPEYWPNLPHLALPVTLLAGEKDEKFRRLAGAAAELLPHARLTIAPGASHDVLLERPDLVAVAIEEQLEEKQRHD